MKVTEHGLTSVIGILEASQGVPMVAVVDVLEGHFADRVGDVVDLGACLLDEAYVFVRGDPCAYKCVAVGWICVADEVELYRVRVHCVVLLCRGRLGHRR